MHQPYSIANPYKLSILIRFYFNFQQIINGIDILRMLIDNTVKMAMELNAFNSYVNVAIDEHDEPYTGKYNPYLKAAPWHTGLLRWIVWSILDLH